MRTFQEQILSAVIPTLNAAASLPQTLAIIAGSPIVREIIIVDGGSSDQTRAMAQGPGIRVIVAARGRGNQLAAGAKAAVGEWLLFLHADCRLEPDWEDVVADFVAADGASGRAGYFDLALDDTAPAARRLERLVAWRCRVLVLPYGDQGLLISRALYDAVGGFAPIPLMEDVDLARRLGRRRLAPIGARCLTSAARYRNSGYWRRPMRNLCCLACYFAGMPPARIARLYG
ncbi:MAG TPA: TIGR04283 family arsenosugar biosynthesis glycosyltransferase [Stellaceae bacterium]|jgi:rSAM/selenodomain-associated transferase 2